MCDECVKLDQKIENYRRMIVRVSDPLTTEAVERLIKGIQAQKAALHPEKTARPQLSIDFDYPRRGHLDRTP